MSYFCKHKYQILVMNNFAIIIVLIEVVISILI